MKSRILILASLVILATFVGSSHAQKGGRWASARDRGLRGAVRSLVTTCSDSSGKYDTTFKYEFATDGKLVTISAPQFPQYDCILTIPETRKGTKRNAHGDVEEVSYFLEGDLTRKQRGEYSYDNVGNWTNLVTSEMLTYTWEGGPPEGSWRVINVCTREIEYYR